MSPLGSREELVGIIRNNLLTPVYQPIVSLNQRQLYGYEALIRGPANSSLHNPLTLFDTAHRNGLLATLEGACLDVSWNRFQQSGMAGKLFLNVSPMSLTEKGFEFDETATILSRTGITCGDIVIELTEQYPLDDYALLREATDQFRSAGFKIAIDDLGAGYAGLRTWSELRPDFVKIDRHFIERIHSDSVKREFVRSILDIAAELDCKVIAEGIETLEDLNTVEEMGVAFGQGYFIGVPETNPENEAIVLERIGVTSAQRRKLHRISVTAEQLTLTSPQIAPTASLASVSEIFQKNRDINCLPVVDDGKPVGIAARQEILELFSQRYTRELHGRKPISDFMNTKPVIVSHTVVLEEISRLLTDSHSDELIQNFIVTRDGIYYGIGKTSTLLRRITEQQIRNARYANPLTLLPGNVPIHEHVEERLKANEEFYIAYFDLNNFKPYNDHYGYSRGDDVIVGVSQILTEHADLEHDFVGHVGGDDFVIVFGSKDWNERCVRILEQFSRLVTHFYCEQAIAERGIWGVSRAGEKQFFELLGLAVGVARPDPQFCHSYHDVAALAVDAKKQAKLQAANTVYVSRREKPDLALA